MSFNFNVIAAILILFSSKSYSTHDIYVLIQVTNVGRDAWQRKVVDTKYGWSEQTKFRPVFIIILFCYMFYLNAKMMEHENERI